MPASFIPGDRARARRFTAWLPRAARRLLRAAAEIDRQQKRLAGIRLSPEAYIGQAGTAPDTYAEFLFRTSGPLRHEPSARWRLAGRKVR